MDIPKITGVKWIPGIFDFKEGFVTKSTEQYIINFVYYMGNKSK